MTETMRLLPLPAPRRRRTRPELHPARLPRNHRARSIPRPPPTIAPTPSAKPSSATKPSTNSPTCRFAGAIDARTDTHQRDRPRPGATSGGIALAAVPLFAVRRLSATYTRGKLTVRSRQAVHPLGQGRRPQPHRPLRPARFPQRGGYRLPAPSPRPASPTARSRTPSTWSSRRASRPAASRCSNQRWAVLPPGIPLHELDPDFPGGPQFGARWNHIGAAAEYSLLLLQRLRPSAALPRAAQLRPAARRRAALLSADAHVRRRRRRPARAGHAEGRGRVLHLHQSRSPTSTCSTCSNSNARPASGRSSAATPAR